jgi:hypothetical protein
MRIHRAVVVLQKRPIAVVCDDLIDRTDDRCIALKGCQYKPIHSMCGDADACTSMNDVMLQWAARTTPWFVMTRLIALTTPAMPSRVAVGIHRFIACAVTMMHARVNERCDATVGCTYNAVVCDDSIDCTDDTCDAVEGCQYTPDDSICGDDDECSVNERCDAKVGCTYRWVCR